MMHGFWYACITVGQGHEEKNIRGLYIGQKSDTYQHDQSGFPNGGASS